MFYRDIGKEVKAVVGKRIRKGKIIGLTRYGSVNETLYVIRFPDLPKTFRLNPEDCEVVE